MASMEVSSTEESYVVLKKDSEQIAATSSDDYEKPPLKFEEEIKALHKSVNRKHKKSVSKATVTKDARNVFEQFLMTPENELKLMPEEHSYVFVKKRSLAEKKHLNMSYDSSDNYQYFQPSSSNEGTRERQIHEKFENPCHREQYQHKRPIKHHYYELDQAFFNSSNLTKKEKNDIDFKNSTKFEKMVGFQNLESNTLFYQNDKQSHPLHHPEYIPRSVLKQMAEAKVSPLAQAEDDAISSSSTEDYEFPDKELINRKKKNGFRLALERVRHSLLRQKEDKEDKRKVIRASERCRSRSSSGGSKKRVVLYDTKEQHAISNKTIFEGILQRFVKKKKKRRTEEKEHRSRSADNLPRIARTLNQLQTNLLNRHVFLQSDQQPCDFLLQLHKSHQNKHTLPLDHLDYDSDNCSRQSTYQSRCKYRCIKQTNTCLADREDVVDGENRRQSNEPEKADKVVPPSSPSSSSPLKDQKDSEAKEELYKKVALQLAAIADNLVWSFEDDNIRYGNPPNACITLEKFKPVCNAESSVQRRKMAVELLDKPSYSKFEKMIGETNNEGEMGKLAMCFRLARCAIEMAGGGSVLGKSIKDIALNYFDVKLSGWMAERGGWESMVEDETGEEMNSELD